MKFKIQKLHKKIADTRRDFLHKTTSAISKNHAVVVVEDLQVKNMSKSASGTIESPGRNVKAKSGLNKSILDQGWGEFVRQLGYKLSWLGGKLLKIAPQYTSQKCSHCGCTLLISTSAAGHAVSACGEERAQASSMKQEPAWATTTY